MIASNLAVFAWKPVDETKIKFFQQREPSREQLKGNSSSVALNLQSHVSFLKDVPLILVKLSPRYKGIGLWQSIPD